MHETHPYLIVGGGPVGLLAAKVLTQHGVAFQGLEKAAKLGGTASILPTRLFAEESVRFLQGLMPELNWDRTESAPIERQKGEWKTVQDSEISAIEKPYLQTPYFYPNDDWTQRLVDELRQSFALHSNVEEIRPDEKKVLCSDGKEYSFGKLLWCADIEKLRKAWKGDNLSLLKTLKGLPEPAGAFDLELELSTPLRNEAGAILFPFRYKERKLRAIGVHGTPLSSTLHWLVPLEEEISEDREEIAKCVRTLKRELGKEFTDLKEKIRSEKIVFFPDLVPSDPKEVKTLSTLPDVLYLGPQLRREESDKGLIHLDVAIDNCRYFDQTLKG